MCTAYFSTPFLSLKLKGKAKWGEEMREGGEDHDITGGLFFFYTGCTLYIELMIQPLQMAGMC